MTVPTVEEIDLELERRSFRRWVERVRPKYLWYPHCDHLGAVLQRVAEGELKRVMIFMPPRHSKSETASRLFSGYHVDRFRDRWVGLCSYSADLAFTLSRAAQENYRHAGGTFGRAAAVDHWETGQGGGMWSAGVGGAITGKGFHLGIIDDPFKNAESAASAHNREKVVEWWQSTFYTRAEPDAAIVLINTRWHEEDLTGWLLAQELTGDSPEAWHVVSMEALKEETLPEIPPTCTLEEDPREPGEALCPERYSAARLKQIERAVGAYYFGAMYQQRPRAKDGNLFKKSWFHTCKATPWDGERVRAWDLAGTEGAGDYTVGVRMRRCPEGRFWIEDVVRGQWGPDRRDAEIKEIAARDGKEVAVWFEEEGGSAGLVQTRDLVRMLAGYDAHGQKSTGSKETRARPLAAQMGIGNVQILEGPWNKALEDELLAFPTGANDDQVDACSLAFNTLAAGGTMEFR
jgi:predicted phage terminase large subunit-like protein